MRLEWNDREINTAYCTIVLAFVVDSSSMLSEVDREFLAILAQGKQRAEDMALKPYGLHSEVLDHLAAANFSDSGQVVGGVSTTIVCTFPRVFSRMLWAYTQSTRNRFEEIKRIQEDSMTRGLPSAVYNDESLIKEWKIFHHVLGRHRLGYSNFNRWLRASETVDSENERAASVLLKEELDEIIEDSCRLEVEMRERIQVHVAALSLEESRKGIQ